MKAVTRLAIVAATVAGAVCALAASGAPQITDYTPPEVCRLTANTLRVCTVFTVDRRNGLVRRIEVPAVQPADQRIGVRFR